MKITSSVCHDAVRRAKKLPDGILARHSFDYAPRVKRDMEAADIARRVDFLSRGGAKPTRVEFERLLGTNDLVDEFYLERALLAAHPVCRISIRAPSGHERGCATGFMVSPRLMLTNHHVFTEADEAAPSIIEFNYRFDVAGRPDKSYRFRLQPNLFFFNNETLDFALVAVEPQSIDEGLPLNTFGYHRLINQTGKILIKEWMTIIQHPGGARRQYAIRENQLIENKDPDVLWYMSDTAQGSSGAPVFNDSFQVVALHHAGVARMDEDTKQFILKSGKKVDDLDGIDDADVDWIANAGIRVSRICNSILTEAPESQGLLAEFKAAMQGGEDVISTSYNDESRMIGEEGMSPRININQTGGGTRIVLGTLVLELNGGMASPGQTVVQTQPQVAPATQPLLTDGSSAASETYKVPIIDTDYDSRKGFDVNFLGIKTPLPTVTNKTLIAPMIDGATVIPYEHFSVVLHKNRRMAIFTASNVDGSTKAKKPDPAKQYSRKALGGLGEHDIEKWALDPRVEEDYQIPDAFYTKDNGAFDKGHIVRREDVCFGKTYAEVRRANGDTYHVTNCSPQRGNFNQSKLGGIWGNLENYIGAQADTERFCLFAGPVLSPKDKFFDGKLRVQIPTRFWKVVCAVKNKKLQVFPFLLEQDVKDLPLEFQVDAEWKHTLRSLKELEKIIQLVKFPQVYHTADQGK
ncbi:MAG TPA: DNA/RNA non-specific endonuclease [Pyrinomonadaceae bacterium]|nr:DNA/RNA non-specific endonuclease [Pyrinomonadaceae bacterium]